MVMAKTILVCQVGVWQSADANYWVIHYHVQSAVGGEEHDQQQFISRTQLKPNQASFLNCIQKLICQKIVSHKAVR